MITLNLLIKAGSRYDPQGREGLANLAARLLTYGTRSRTALQISEEIDFIGAGLSTGCSEDLATVSLTLLKKDLDAGLNLLADVLTASVFPPEEIDRQKKSVIASIRARDEEPGAIAQTKFLEALFPGSPYGRPVEGTEGAVERMERAELVEFHGRFYRPNRVILIEGVLSKSRFPRHLPVRQTLSAFKKTLLRPTSLSVMRACLEATRIIMRFRLWITSWGAEGFPRD